MSLKNGLNEYFSRKKLNNKQLKLLNGLLENADANSYLFPWGVGLIALTFAVALIAQWQIGYHDSNNVIITEDSLTKNLILTYSKKLAPDYSIKSIDDISKNLTSLDFNPINPMSFMPVKDCKLIGASYILLGDSVGLYMLFEDPISKKRITVIQKPDDIKELHNQSEDLVAGGINVRKYFSNGVLTALAW